MATNLEALGAASAVLQVISLTTSVISNCKKVFDVKPTAHVDLEIHAGQMSDAINRIQDRCQILAETQPSKYNEKLKDIANECMDAAKGLENEVQSVAAMRKKGSLFQAVNAILRASSHRQKIERLELALSRCKKVMETEMISDLCTKSDAIELQQKEEFRELESDVQMLVAQISRGHINLEELFRTENDLNREVVIQESANTQKAITDHVTAKVEALGIDAGAEVQRTTLLNSLNFPEMNQRYNDLMSSRQASFKRVFASYKELTSTGDGYNRTEGRDNSKEGEIDKAWESFVKWLQSDDSLFCIRGKPGSGKSTLVKFIIDDKNTKKLLSQWSSDVVIMSHFFWKIGSAPQNSIKGFLCTLVYTGLSQDPEIVKQMLDHFPALSSKTSYHDWSTEDLMAVLYSVLGNNTRQLCIFIDGLDEISNSDGLYKLTQVIEEILKFPKVKLCVSSRPETLIMNWLKKRQTPSILLEDLTRPEMRTFVHKELDPFLANSSISDKTHWRLTYELVNKAQGVFLWLHLATRSVTTGIQNEDPHEMLLARLNELPSELKELYADMWQRLNENNPVYRETCTAARFFNYALDKKGPVPMFPEVGFPSGFPEVWQATLFQIACAESIETQNALLTGENTMSATEVMKLCDKTSAAIQTRCAGLLRITPISMSGRIMQHIGDANDLDLPEGTGELDNALFNGVDFIHRTAHDFLTDTETGRDILKYGALSEREMEFRLIKGLLCLLQFLHSEYGLMGRSSRIIWRGIDLSIDQDKRGMEEVADLLRLIQNLYDKGVIGADLPSWQQQPPFHSHLTEHAQLDDFVISSLRQAGSKDLATAVLREAWDPDQSLYYSKDRMPSDRLVEALISMGADPHAYGPNRGQQMGRMEPFAREGSAFSNLLMSGINSIDDGDHLGSHSARQLLMAAVRMAQTCPDLNRTTLVLGRFKEKGKSSLLNVTWLTRLKTFIGNSSPGILYEVDFKFLLLQILSGLAVDIDETSRSTSKVDELLPKLENPSAIIRFVITIDAESKAEVAHQIAPELSSTLKANDLIERQFAPGFGVHSRLEKKPTGGKAAYKYVMSLTRHKSTQRIDYEDAIIGLAEKEIGFCTFLKAGIVPSPSFVEHLEEHYGSWLSRGRPLFKS